MNINEENIAWLRTFDFEGTTQVVNAGKINIADIVRTVIVADLTTCLLVYQLVFWHGKIGVIVVRTQSTHWIFTVSPFLMVPANGTSKIQPHVTVRAL